MHIRAGRTRHSKSPFLLFSLLRRGILKCAHVSGGEAHSIFQARCWPSALATLSLTQSACCFRQLHIIVSCRCAWLQGEVSLEDQRRIEETTNRFCRIDHSAVGSPPSRTRLVQQIRCFDFGAGGCGLGRGRGRVGGWTEGLLGGGWFLVCFAAVAQVWKPVPGPPPRTPHPYPFQNLPLTHSWSRDAGCQRLLIISAKAR